jgi:hypothetical protein
MAFASKGGEGASFVATALAASGLALEGSAGRLTIFAFVHRVLASSCYRYIEPLAKFIDRVIFPPLEGASLSPPVKPESA